MESSDGSREKKAFAQSEAVHLSQEAKGKNFYKSKCLYIINYMLAIGDI